MVDLVPFDIQRVDYVEQSFLPDRMNHKTKYLIYPDGKIVVKYYPGNSRKCESKAEYLIERRRVWEFYNRLVECTRNINGFEPIIDDTSGSITIHYPYGHTERIDRCMRSNDVFVADIVSDLLVSFMPD